MIPTRAGVGCVAVSWLVVKVTSNMYVWECVNYGREDSPAKFAALVQMKMILFPTLLESLLLPLVKYS